MNRAPARVGVTVNKTCEAAVRSWALPPSISIFFPSSQNNDFQSWSEFPMRNNNKGGNLPLTLARQTVTPGCTHSFNSRLKQHRPLMCVCVCLCVELNTGSTLRSLLDRCSRISHVTFFSFFQLFNNKQVKHALEKTRLSLVLISYSLTLI